MQPFYFGEQQRSCSCFRFSLPISQGCRTPPTTRASEEATHASLQSPAWLVSSLRNLAHDPSCSGSEMRSALHLSCQLSDGNASPLLVALESGYWPILGKRALPCQGRQATCLSHELASPPTPCAEGRTAACRATPLPVLSFSKTSFKLESHLLGDG